MKTNQLISPEAIKYFDKEAFELVSLMDVVTNPKKIDQEPLASMAEANAIEWSGPIENFIESHGDMIRSIMGNKMIGFSHATGERFSKFVDNIQKTPQIRARVSKSFVKDLTFKWLVNTKEKGQAPSDFSSHLLTSIEEATNEYKIFYHVVCLFLNTPFSLGNVQFGFFTKEYFKVFADEWKANHLDNDVNAYEQLWEKYPGRCYAMMHVKAENERAKDIAFKYCSRAIDVLKICSPTLNVPQFECTFEIDKRLTRNTETEILVETVKNNRGLSVSLYGAGHPFSLTDGEMTQFKLRGLDVFDSFLQEFETDPTELKKMIVIAIERLASSFVLKDLHQRVAEICSILESLLLLNDSGSMTEIVCRYFRHLVHSEPDRRKELDKIYKKLYGIRSAWVHHAKRIQIDLAELSYLQQCVQRLLQVLIGKTKEHTTKETVLAEIDDALFNA